jgi:hypothetical protein
MISNQEDYASLRDQIPDDLLSHMYESRRMSMEQFERLRQVFDNESFHNFHLRAYISACISDLTTAQHMESNVPFRITTQLAWKWIDQVLYNTYYYTFHTMPPPRDADPLCARTAARGDYYNPIRVAFMAEVVRMFQDADILEMKVADIFRMLRKHVGRLAQSDASNAGD